MDRDAGPIPVRRHSEVDTIIEGDSRKRGHRIAEFHRKCRVLVIVVARTRAAADRGLARQRGVLHMNREGLRPGNENISGQKAEDG